MTDSRIIARCVLLLGMAIASSLAMAQAIPPSAAASAAADKAQKETDRTMYWIRVLAATPAAKPAAKPVAVPALQARTAVPERMKVAVAAPSTQRAAEIATAMPTTVVAAEPPLPAAASLADAGNDVALNSGSTEAGVSSATLAGGVAASTVTPAPIDVPVAEEAPDPGLLMTKSVEPEFPRNTMNRLRKGEVQVKFEVGPDGVVDVVTVTKTTSPSLNNAAVEAVRQWRFKPTPKGHTAMAHLTFDIDS